MRPGFHSSVLSMLNHALSNLLDPAILFFFLGCLMAAVRSNLDIPPPIARFFSLYLLMAMGFKGGVALAESPGAGAWIPIACALLLAVLAPAWGYAVLRRRFSPFDAAAIAAAYGSVSAVTFITATQFLERLGVSYGGYMMVAMVLMESPAIIMAVLLANLARRHVPGAAPPHGFREILREAFTDGAQLLLVGSLVIGAVVGPEGKKVLDPFTGQLFKGILAFFLLEMGMLVVRRAREVRAELPGLLMFGLAAPVVNAVLALGLAWGFGLSDGDGLLLMVLAASASYIVVPAVLREAVPEANPGLYFGAALVVTFPFNIVLGIPLYHALIQRVG